MPNNNPSDNNSAASDLIPEVDSIPTKPATTGDVKPARARRAKPLVEGINAPVSSPSPFGAAQSGLEKLSSKELSQTLDIPSAQSPVIPPKITLTTSEKQLIDDSGVQLPPQKPAVSQKPKIFPEQPVQKIVLPGKKPGRKLVWSLLISLLAVSVVFGLLLWYNNQTGGSLGQGFNFFSSRPGNNQPSGGANNPFVPPPATITPPAATSTPVTPTPAVKQLKVTATPTGYLNVRSLPSTSGKQLTRVSPGDVYPYSQTQNGWYFITLSNGTEGWVTGEYVEILK